MAAIETLPDFPSAIPVRREPYRNWVGTIQQDDVWTCEPRDTADVVAVANWAQKHGYRLRVRGRSHNFSPLTVTNGSAGAPILLLDTTKHLAGMHIAATRPAAVQVGAGATLDALLAFLESHGLGLAAMPGTGDLTVGGMLAVGAHGTGIPFAEQSVPSGHLYGTLSNLVVSLTAVVWDAAEKEYVARTFDRSHPDCAAFLVHLGRACLTEVTLRVGVNYTLRCISQMAIPGSAIFAPQDPMPRIKSGQSFADLVEQDGRVEVIWFPYTDRTWIKHWTVQAARLPRSRAAITPYNYPFTDCLPEPIADMVSRITNGSPELAPDLELLLYSNIVQGLSSTGSADLVGPSKNLLLYVRPSTLRYTTNGYAICTRRAEIQRVVHEFADFLRKRLQGYQQQNEYPVNGPIEIRVTGLDSATSVGVSGARPPALSAAAVDSKHPEWDVAVWLDLLTFPGTRGADAFYRELEEFVFANYHPPYAQARVEWSKGWAYTAEGPWTNHAMLTSSIPSTFGESWQWAQARLAAYDPHRIYGNEFLDQFL